MRGTRFAVVAFISAVVTAIACSSGGGGPGPGGKGLCEGSCPKTCSADTDCPTGTPLCCDFGAKGKACTTPQGCYPARFCTDDSKCNTTNGETCCTANPLALDQKVCAPATSCRKACGTDNDCAGTNTPKCCGLYAKSICTTAESCPNTCKQTSDCNTGAGETCCTAIKALLGDAAGNVPGVCLPQGAASACPKACTQSTDCNTAGGELCCNGFCSKSCQKACDTNNDCDTSKGQFCCNTGALASPWYGFAPYVPPPPCGGGNRCTHASDCSGGQICCGQVFGGNSTCTTTCGSTCRASNQCQGTNFAICP